MSEVEETALPGVGVRFSFLTSDGDRLTVLHKHSGMRELCAADPADPDASRVVAELDEQDSRTLAELLGVSRVVRDIDRLQQALSGLVIDWLAVERGGPGAGRSIGQLEIRSTTGATVLAVVRGDEPIPIPGPEFVLEAGDVAVVMGRRETVERAHDLLRR